MVSKSSQTLSRFRVQGTLLALTTSELLLLYYLLRRCHLAIQFHLHCENLSATHLAANPVFHARSKHIYISLQPLPSPFPVSLSRLTHRSVRSFIALLAHYPRRAPPLSFKWELFLWKAWKSTWACSSKKKSLLYTPCRMESRRRKSLWKLNTRVIIEISTRVLSFGFWKADTRCDDVRATSPISLSTWFDELGMKTLAVRKGSRVLQ